DDLDELLEEVVSVGGRRRVLRLRGLRTGAVVREAQREQVRDAGQLIPTGWVVRVVAGTRGRARRASLPPVGDVSYGIVVVAVVLGRIVRSVGADGLSEPSVPVVGEVHRLGASGPASSSEHVVDDAGDFRRLDRKSTRLNSSHVSISYAVFCLKKKNVDPIF